MANFVYRSRCVLVLFLLLLGTRASAQTAVATPDKPQVPLAAPITKGQRVMSAGHSFHFFVPKILSDIAQKAGIEGHVQIDLQAIGGSRVIQHWNVPDEQNKVKRALRTGQVDVLTLSPIFLPDEGLRNFVRLALEHNPDIRILVQESWLPYDRYNPSAPLARQEVDRETWTGDALRKIHAEPFKNIDDHVRELNKESGKQAVFVVPAGQAVIGLREKIAAGQSAGIKTQKELFTDELGHGTAPLQVLVAYCNFAVIYRRSPVGLPMPAALAKPDQPTWEEKLNRVLQEVAWEAVVRHPLSGVQASAKP